MNICFSKEVFQKFLAIQGVPKKTSLELELASIFECIDSKFILSENYLDLLQEEIKLFSGSQQYLENFFTELFDTNNKRIIIKPGQNQSDSSNEFVKLAEKFSDSDTLVICVQNKKVYQNLQNFIVLYNSLSATRFFDLQYFRFKVAAKGIISFTSHDFANESEIKDIISNFLSINPDNIIIFSRDFEVYRSGIFSGIPNNGFDVKFYSRRFATSYQKDLSRENMINSSDLTAHKKKLKQCFGNKLRMFLTSRVDMIHERRILVDNWILTVDDDFNNLIPRRPTWTLTISYSETLSAQILNKISHFNEFI